MIEYLALGLTSIILPWVMKQVKRKPAGERFLLSGGLLFILSATFSATDFWQYQPGFNLSKIIVFNIVQFLAWASVTIGLIQTIASNLG